MTHSPTRKNIFRLLPVDGGPFYGYIMQEEDRCLNRFPDCPTIQCQKRKHPNTFACHAVGVDPYYYSIIWNPKGEREER